MSFISIIFKIVGGVLLAILLVAGISALYIVNIDAPEIPVHDNIVLPQKKKFNDSTFFIGDNWYRKNSFGLYEMYVSGSPLEMGIKNGVLSEQQILKQEVAFTDQIRKMIPSDKYLRFLKHLIRFIHRDLDEFITEEYLKEIFGVSRSASNDKAFSWIGNSYERILNYHAAHDIGHALQNMMLVGCTSFAAWDSSTYNGSLLVGRNFDFWVGDEFAKEKIIGFYRPQKGIPFMSVTWGGFTGVASGMNTAGLTVTINAAKSEIPWGGAATPVSLVAREVLQYAHNIDEAIRIAHSRKMFISESFLVSSAVDHKAVIIEKTPDTLSVYQVQDDHILCTNHYQSDILGNQELNEEQKQESASVYRYERLKELVSKHSAMTPSSVAHILRDQRGKNDNDIGWGNEKAVNQLIAHHSIIFQPDSLKVWVSTSPWQLGTFVCYDLRKVFHSSGIPLEEKVSSAHDNIPADTVAINELYAFLKFRSEKFKLLEGSEVDTATLIYNNPFYYDSWRLAGDYAVRKSWNSAAIRFYKRALQLEIATQGERRQIEEKLKELQDK